MNIGKGFHEHERAQVAALYWNAFGEKLGRVLGPETRATRFFADVLDPTHALCARDSAGQLIGVAGFKTYQSALVGGGLRDLARHYGWIGTFWRAGLLALLERDTDNDRFLMDGIFVDAQARGQGVGSALLGAIADEAARRGFQQVRLDVIDSNPRARALYERHGFAASGVQTLGPLRYVFGFRSATTMVKTL